MNKRSLLIHLLRDTTIETALVFTRTKHGADRLSEQLEKDGVTAAAIHGNKSQGARTRALSDFKTGNVRVLVATDIAARGIDIEQLPHVVNFELPNVPEDYVHRIGRTGRAGKEGQAISLVCVDEHKLLKDIERVLKRDVKKEIISGYEPNPAIRAEPIQNGRSGGASGGQRPRSGQGSSQGNNQGNRQGNSSGGNQSRSSFGGGSDRSGNDRNGNRSSSQGRSSEGNRSQSRSTSGGRPQQRTRTRAA